MIPPESARQHNINMVDSGTKWKNSQDELVDKLKSLVPGVVDSDNRVNITALQDVIDLSKTTSNAHGYELMFAGKGLAKAEADAPPPQELKAELEQSKNFDETSNVVIRGDNLEVLKILHQNYYGKIKMIYIDPPYNTKKDNFVYDDNFKISKAHLIEQFGLTEDIIDSLQDVYSTQSHSGWLCFIYPRLKVAKDLLSNDGVIFISIDDNEQSNIKLLCDEIFGKDNFIGMMIWQTATDNNATQISIEHEYIICYAKNKQIQQDWEISSDKAKAIQKKYEEIKRNVGNIPEKIQSQLSVWINEQTKKGSDLETVAHYHYVDYKGVFYPGNSANPRSGGYDFDIIHPNTNMICKKPKNGYRWPKETFQAHVKKDNVLWGENHNTIPKIKKRIETAAELLKSVYYEDNRNSTHELTNLFNCKIFDNPKSPKLIKKLIKFSSGEDALILDFFAGSGTTGDAIMHLNAEDGGKRKFILVQNDEVIDKKDNMESYGFCIDNNLKPVISSITLERLNRVGENVEKEHSDKCVDIGYKTFSLITKPQIRSKDAQTQLLSVDHSREKTIDILINMLCATGKPLDTPIEIIVQDILYKADDELYLIQNTDLFKYTNYKININGWSNIDLEQYLNLSADNNNLNVVY